jgi:hypothetical protein
VHDIARAVIVHHAGEDKPWRRYGRRKRLFPDRSAYRLYEAFLEDTPWPGWLDQQWSASDLCASAAWEVKRFTRALRGRLGEPSAEQRQAYLDAFRIYCGQGTFADVEQGLVERASGMLRLGHA